MENQVEPGTSVDVLIERLKSHPHEFYNSKCIVDRNAAQLFYGVKFHTLVTVLMVDKQPDEQNLWIDIFSPEERARFRKAFYESIRAVLDTAIMQELVCGENTGVFDPTVAQKRLEEARMKAMQGTIHTRCQGSTAGAAAQNSALGLGQTIGYPPDWLSDSSNINSQYKARLVNEEFAAKIEEQKLSMEAAMGQFKGYIKRLRNK